MSRETTAIDLRVCGGIPNELNGRFVRSVYTNVMSAGGRLDTLVEAGASPIELDYELNSVARSDLGGAMEI